jgi:S-formylglutathione hydrolase
MQLISQNKSFGGLLKRYQHESTVLNCTMTVAIYLPPQAEYQSVPVLYWLSGLTCTDENFMQKSGAQRIAAELGIAIVCPDTSPRGTDLPNEHDSYDLGSGAGFYINATQEPWASHYRMYDYIVDELPALMTQHCPVSDRCSISGHSMGGHGALMIALKNPQQYASVSAFSPICHPTHCDWGKNVFTHYLGEDKSTWSQYDTVRLIEQGEQKIPLWVDQGDQDDFLEAQLLPQALQEACDKVGHPLTLRMQKGYDHSYFFIATFIEDHLRYHAGKLLSP